MRVPQFVKDMKYLFRPESRRDWTLSIIAGVLLLVLAGVGIAYFSTRDSGSHSVSTSLSTSAPTPSFVRESEPTATPEETSSSPSPEVTSASPSVSPKPAPRPSPSKSPSPRASVSPSLSVSPTPQVSIDIKDFWIEKEVSENKWERVGTVSCTDTVRYQVSLETGAAFTGTVQIYLNDQDTPVISTTNDLAAGPVGFFLPTTARNVSPGVHKATLSIEGVTKTLDFTIICS